VQKNVYSFQYKQIVFSERLFHYTFGLNPVGFLCPLPQKDEQVNFISLEKRRSLDVFDQF